MSAARLLATALLAAASLAQQPIVTTVISNGSTQSRYDMVILGDGYRAVEQATFTADVNRFLTGMFQKQPYATFSAYINVHTVFRASVESGASQFDLPTPIVRNNAYGSRFAADANNNGTNRCLYIGNTSLALQDAALAPANESRVVVIVNESRYGGCAGTFSVSYNGASLIEAQVHEVGHSLGGLADEYDYSSGPYTGSERSQPNITIDPLGTRWQHWWGFDGISAFEGAGTYSSGLWRPKFNCLMRALGQPLCAVCREVLSRRINAVANVIENPQPAATSVTLILPTPQTFSFTTFVPAINLPTIEWQLDGIAIAGQTATSLTLDPTTVTAGTHALRAVVTDHTAMVRVDGDGSMVDTRTWNLTVVDPNALNLRLAGVAMTPVTANAGQSVSIATTVLNDGPGTASGVVVEHFLSRDTILETTDVYLGSVQFSQLPPGSQAITRTVALPASLGGGIWFLIGVVDRDATIAETNEGDNRGVGVLLASVACPRALEYDDDLHWPRDAAAVSIQDGGALHPTVVAPCAAPGSLYVIVWGCSGTAPGTPLGAGGLVPLNIDGCTSLGLGAINGSIFQQFFGTLDALGHGRATLAWPAGLHIAPMPGHLAAVLVDPTNGGFSAIPNAIAFDLQ